MKPNVHVVDDERRLGEVIAMVLRRDGLTVTPWTDPTEFLAALENGEPCDAVLTDLRMDPIDGLEVLRRVHELAADVPVVLITAHATVDTAVGALKGGAFDYLQKPLDNDALKACVSRALTVRRLGRRVRYLERELQERNHPDDVVAESESMRAALDLATRAARAPSTVLIRGASGTGKEVIARAIHFASDRVGGPFVAVNVAAFSPSLLESELFGHEKGAFTGAHKRRAGVFERAHGGTLFLDEIGELDADLQAKLLRVLEEREVTRVGGEAPLAVDVRVVAATHRDLERDIEDGRFREDLYYRLAVIPLRLPPLKDRPEDVRALARRFLADAAAAMERPGVELSDDAERALLAHDWPGNVRELINTIERAVVLARDDVITADDLGLRRPRDGDDPPAEGTPATLAEHLDRATVARLRDALSTHDGKRARAAAELGVERTTLYRLIKKYGLE